MVGSRTFVVRVSESEPRVVVEDVRSRRKLVMTDLSPVSSAIEQLLQLGDDNPGAVTHGRPREVPPA